MKSKKYRTFFHDGELSSPTPTHLIYIHKPLPHSHTTFPLLSYQALLPYINDFIYFFVSYFPPFFLSFFFFSCFFFLNSSFPKIPMVAVAGEPPSSCLNSSFRLNYFGNKMVLSGQSQFKFSAFNEIFMTFPFSGASLQMSKELFMGSFVHSLLLPHFCFALFPYLRLTKYKSRTVPEIVPRVH